MDYNSTDPGQKVKEVFITFIMMPKLNLYISVLSFWQLAVFMH